MKNVPQGWQEGSFVPAGTSGIVRSPKPAIVFAVQPRRWVIERSFARLTKCRRLVRDHECLLPHSAAFIHLAFRGLMLRFLSR